MQKDAQSPQYITYVRPFCLKILNPAARAKKAVSPFFE